MTTIRRNTTICLGNIDTSKFLSISTAELLYTIHSGNRAFEATNLGDATIYYGQSGVSLNSGGIIDAQSAKFWDHVTDNFSLYFALMTNTTCKLVIQEYA